MICGKCGNEMLVYSTSEGEDSITFNYRCPNPACPNYGFKRRREEKKEEKPLKE